MASRFMLANTEQEIMQVLWAKQEPCTSKELLDIFNARGKKWKRQTLNTLLVRLEKQGLIQREGIMIHVLCSEVEYRQRQSQNILSAIYGGSVSNFISALTGKRDISREEEDELNSFIEGWKDRN